MTKKLSFILFFFLISFQTYAKSIELSSVQDTIVYDAKSPAYIHLMLSVPENGYIYSNPKGPGTGKPVLFEISPSPFSSIFITSPVQYTSPLSEEFVWIHKGQNDVYIPVSEDLDFSREFTIELDALFCDDANCTPVSASLNFSIQQGENKGVITTLPDGLHEISASQTMVSEAEISDTSQLPEINFKPVYINTSSIRSLIPAIIAAFLAGMILNVMPCVLPVIGIKVMSLLRLHTENRRTIALHGVVYTTGVIFSFLILASLAAFAGANWGSLFQSRNFIIVMSVVIFALGLSMFGVYTLQTPSFVYNLSPNSSLITSSFLNGLLATILATPCSGPFLGATLAWTLTQTAPVIFAVFISIGAGLAFPFLMLSLFPSLLKKLPKGGVWSITAERILGFILMGSVIYFLSTLSEKYILYTLIILLFISIALWQFGVHYTPLASKKVKIVSLTALLILTFTGVFSANFLLHENKARPSEIKFSYDELQSKVNSGSIVFVQFTADWCPNCAYLESTVLHTERFSSLIDELSIIYMKADLTEGGTEAEGFLEKLGSRSIPFSAVFYPGGFSEPIGLRDMFGIEEIQRAFEEAQSKMITPKVQPLEIDTITL